MLYRIRRFGFQDDKMTVGTREVAVDTVRILKAANRRLEDLYMPPWCSVKIERVHPAGFTDVTTEFLED